MSRHLKYFLFSVILTIVVQPVFAQVETYNIDIECPVDTLIFTGYTVHFDELELCEATGNILYSDIPQEVIMDNGGNPNCDVGFAYDGSSGCVPLQTEQIPEVPKPLVKKQIDDIIKQKKDELKELFKKKFGDKWKDKWKSTRVELLNNINQIVEWLKSLRN